MEACLCILLVSSSEYQGGTVQGKQGMMAGTGPATVSGAASALLQSSLENSCGGVYNVYMSVMCKQSSKSAKCIYNLSSSVAKVNTINGKGSAAFEFNKGQL